MQAILSKQIPYCFSFKKQLFISVLLGLLVAFIIVFLQPFDLYEFQSDYKSLILAGFGALVTVLYFVSSKVENLVYLRRERKWSVKLEVISLILFLFVSSILTHLYNQIFLNDLLNHEFNLLAYSKHGLWFLSRTVPVLLITLPFYLYLRHSFGELIVPNSIVEEVKLSGLNKGENTILRKDTLLFVKASENYVNIFWLEQNEIQQIVYRNTLTAIATQASFLSKCHRSYLVNTAVIKSITGNSQNAKITFYNTEMQIPLSKSYYKTIKSAVSI